MPRDTFNAGNWPGATTGPWGAGLGGSGSADARTAAPAKTPMKTIAAPSNRIIGSFLHPCPTGPPGSRRSSHH
ncbi:hypothetical protein MYCSP_14335 [Mycobacteroides saopaulense]|nr:hypothetical protein MYCSP_14335 [Mycobacteroides saopaulense]